MSVNNLETTYSESGSINAAESWKNLSLYNLNTKFLNPQNIGIQTSRSGVSVNLYDSSNVLQGTTTISFSIIQFANIIYINFNDTSFSNGTAFYRINIVSTFLESLAPSVNKYLTFPIQVENDSDVFLNYSTIAYMASGVGGFNILASQEFYPEPIQFPADTNIQIPSCAIFYIMS